jgi:hypothetical protein
MCSSKSSNGLHRAGGRESRPVFARDHYAKMRNEAEEWDGFVERVSGRRERAA